MAEKEAQLATKEVEENKKADASSSFLNEITGNDVIVSLQSGVEYHGKLLSVDGFMNLALEKAVEFVSTKQTSTLGDVFIRGNNVLYISAA